MGHVKLKFPEQKPLSVVSVPVRIGDINYGGHVGNDAVLSIMHEARMLMLHSNDWDELHAGGNSLIMADAMVAYKGEAFYGDVLTVKLYAEEITMHSFALLYHISTLRNGIQIDIAHAKTGMVCFDYNTRKIAPMTGELNNWLQRHIA